MASPFASITITREEFHLFHSIDRQLYARLVQNLGRNPGQSMQVMAMWLWLERTGYTHNLVIDLLRWPDFMINDIADETVTCLNCIDDDDELMMPPLSYDANSIPLLRSFTKGGAVSLRFFQENWMAVIKGVSEVVDGVCIRAFDDIFPNTIDGGNVVFGDDGILGNHFPSLSLPMYFSGVGVVKDMGSSSNGTALLHTPINIGEGEARQRLNPTHLSADEERAVPTDERTLFLTFSKGYPLSKIELKDFFTRKYGDVIEAFHMQEVNNVTEQPLYARLVVRSSSTIEVVLQGSRNAKFSINGKHVRARKFVKNNSRSPRISLSPPSSGSTSPPTSQD